MILNSTIKIIDNSGIKTVFTLGHKKIYLKKNTVFNIYTVIIKKISPNFKYNIKTLISYTLVVASKIKINTKRGWITQFNNTSGIMLNLRTLNPLSTRVLEPVSIKLYKLNKYKISSLIEEYF